MLMKLEYRLSPVDPRLEIPLYGNRVICKYSADCLTLLVTSHMI